MARLSYGLKRILLVILLVFGLTIASNQQSLAQTAVEHASIQTSTDTTRQRYIVQLQGQALVPFAASISRNRPKEQALDLQQRAVQSQRTALQRNRQQALRSLQQALGRQLPIIAEFDTNLHAIALELNPIEARRILKNPSVQAVYPERIHTMTTDYGPRWIGAEQIHSGAIAGLANGYQGEGVVVGIIDSGINMLHPSFAELGADGYEHVNPFGQGNFIGACDPSNQYYQPSIVCNNKLIGAWTFASIANIDTQTPSPHDDDGHGSHTASTVAGNLLDNVIYGGINYGPISGVAPHANIIAYDVCGFMDGFMYIPDCPTIPILQAIEQATLDQVDVINFSISGGVDPWDDPIEQAFLAARQAGIVVVTSAGNQGPSASSVNHVSPWLLSVAATSHDRQIQKRLTNIHTSSQSYGEIIGLGNSAALPDNTPIIYAGNLTPSNPTCNPFNATQAQQIAGKIVLCNFSSSLQSRVTKAQTVLSAGGAGIILANLPPLVDQLASETYPLPAIEIYEADGNLLRNLLNSLSEPLLASISATERISQPSNADIVADFSSRGPALQAHGNTIKPDLAAPGVAILAAVADTGGASADFDFYDGTSMASPHVAGSAALLAGLHPDWSAGEIQSALMLTALPNLKNEDNTDATAFDRGSGRVRVDAAALAGLVLDESVEHFYQANPALGGQPSTLNLASMAQQQCLVQCTWSRTFRNTQNYPVTWQITSDQPDLSISPSSFTIAANGQQSVQFTLDVSSQTLGSYIHRQVNLSNNSNLPNLQMPLVALNVGTNQKSAYIYERSNPNFSMLHSLSSLPVTALGSHIAGLVQGTTQQGSITEGNYHRIPVTVPANTDRLVADIRSTSSPDLDLFVMYDANNNGNLDSNDSLVCMSAKHGSKEYCSIDTPASGKYFIDVENFEASSNAGDSYQLSWAVVPDSSNNNLQLSLPNSNPTGSAFTLTEQFALTSLVGQSWYGSYQLTDPSSNTSLGRTNIDVHHVASSNNQLKILAGNQQSSSINQAFGTNLTVRLTDSTGNPLIGQQISFSAPNSGASAIFPSGSSHNTNYNGVVSVPIHANGLVGSYTVVAQSGDLQVEFQLNNQTSPTPPATNTPTPLPTSTPTTPPATNTPTPLPATSTPTIPVVNKYQMYLPYIRH
jgi:subtilisin family serine protease